MAVMAMGNANDDCDGDGWLMLDAVAWRMSRWQVSTRRQVVRNPQALSPSKARQHSPVAASVQGNCAYWPGAATAGRPNDRPGTASRPRVPTPEWGAKGQWITANSSAPSAKYQPENMQFNNSRTCLFKKTERFTLMSDFAARYLGIALC
jgi:hypothetical protein